LATPVEKPPPPNINGLLLQTSLRAQCGFKGSHAEVTNLAGTGPPENETAAPAGNKGGGKKEIRDEPHTYTRHSATARWHQLGDVTAYDADPHRKPSQAIRGELIGSDQCCALGYTARGYTPVLRLCRMLIDAGYDPTTPLHCYRGETLCLLVRSIGEAATLEPNSGGTRFTRRRIRRRTTVRAAPPVAPLATDAPRPHTVDKKHLARRPAPAVRCTQSRRVKVSNGSKQICQRPPLHQAG